MKKMVLGKTGIEVTELIFGALPIGPNQKNVPVEEASEIIALALRQGVNFIDTAQGYRTYPHIRMAMDKTGIRPVISSKSPAETYDDMEKAVNEALEALGTDYIDIFLLHAARAGTDVFEKRSGALKCLLDYREKGKLKAVGISSHDAKVVAESAERPELDIVFPIINKLGMGVLNGSLNDMENAISRCFDNEKGVFFMKALAGGNLVNDYAAAMEYVRNFSAGRAPIALGMVDETEVLMNVRYFNGEDISDVLADLNVPSKQFLILPGICLACEKCVNTCHSSAVSIVEGIASIDDSKCLKCGYCVEACPQFAIRMI